MTARSHTTPSSLSQDLTIDALYDQALAFVQANQDASCSRLQRHLRIGYGLTLRLLQRLEENGALEGIARHVKPAQVLIRIVDLTDAPTHALVELIACDASGHQRLAATSAPMLQDAAKAITRLYEKTDNIPPTFHSLKAVLGKTGRTSWANAASLAHNAAENASLKACANLKAQGINLNTVGQILVITSMTPESRFIDVIKTVLNAVRSELQPEALMATAIVIDATLTSQVQVQLLVSGL